MRRYAISVPFGGVSRPFGGVSRPFGGVSRLFGGVSRLFGGVSRLFGGVSRPRLRLRGSAWSLVKIVSITLLGVLAYALYAFSNDYTFFVYKASIQGNRLLPAETIYAASGVHGYSIFWLSPWEISERVEAHPYVKRAVAHCQVPDRVVIEVTERLPRLVWRVGAEEYWVDDEGVALTPLSDLAVRRGLPTPSLLLIDDEGRVADGSEPPRLKAALVKGILLVADSIPEITRFRYDRKWGLFFQSPHGWQVALGYGEELPYKVEVLLRLEEDLLATGQRPQLIDLRFSGGMRYR